MSLVAELQRRNVLRVAVAYVVASWLLVQVLEIATDAFEAPAWVLKLFITLAAVGMAPVLMFSWIYEMTPEGLRLEKDIEPSESITAHTAKKLDTVVIMLLVFAIGLFAYDRFVAPPAPAVVEAPTPVIEATQEPREASAIAVLPFTDMSPDGDQGYFADGISEEILNLLAKNADLRVIARTSAFQFRETADLREVGEALNANRILEGSVRTAGTRVRITAQLIDTDTNLHLWSETYDRELTDIFAVQDEIAAAITEALGVHLGVATVAKAPVSDATLGAYNLYLQGRKALNERSEPGRLAAGIELLERATAADPTLVVAHGTLALAHSLSFFYVPGVSVEDATHAALVAAEHALSLDPDSVEGLIARGYVLAHNRYQFAVGRVDLLRALELRPNDQMAVNLLGDTYRISGETAQMLHYEQRAVEQDPLDPAVHADLSWSLQFAGRYGEAIPHARRALSLNPDSSIATFAELWALTLAGRPDEAERKLDAFEVRKIYFAQRGISSTTRLLIALVRAEDDAHARIATEFADRGGDNNWPMTLAFLTGDLAETARLWQGFLEAGDFLFVVGSPFANQMIGELEAAGYELRFPPELDELTELRHASPEYQRRFSDDLAAARAAYQANHQ